MNIKTTFKRILPVLIAILVVVIIAVVSTVATGAKKNPTLSNASEGYIVYTTSDGKEIKVSNEKVWNTLKGSVTATTTTVSEILDQLDSKLLETYISAVTKEEVSDKIAEYLFGSSFDEYIKENKAAWELAAKKKGNNDWEVEALAAIKEVLEAKVEELKYSYGLDVKVDEFKYLENGSLILTDELDDNGEKVYSFAVTEGTALYNYYKVPVARTNYALEKLTKEYEEEVAKYNEYLEKLEAYNEYLKDLEDYEEDLEDWKNTGKEGAKPTKPAKVEKPETVEEPVLLEEDFETLFKEDYQNTYYAVLVPFASNQAAVDALYQLNIVIAKNRESDYVWFNAADLKLADEAARKEFIEEDYSVRGDSDQYESGIITDNAFYERLIDKKAYDLLAVKKESYIVYDGDNKALACGAYPLSNEEIKEAIVKLYNQFYQANPEKELVKDVDFTVTDGVLTFKETEQIKYSQDELKTFGLYAETTSNKFNKFDATNTDFEKFYSNKVVTAGSNYYLYYIVAKKAFVYNDLEVEDWEDVVEVEGNGDYTATKLYKDNYKELLEGKLTATYTNEAVAELRYEKGLKIYDADLEEVYMANYKSDYKALKKTSKTVVASVEGLEIKLDELFETLTDKYGILTALESYQYDWIFLEAKDAEGNLINTYVDYAGYKAKGKNLGKFIADNEEAKDLYIDVQAYVTNTKNNFASGSYESQGYAADYGWENFMRDYFLESYGVEINSTDDLALFYIYQEIVNDYAKELAKLNKEKWDEVVALYMAQQLSTYLNCAGEHLLISVYDEDGNMVDPVNWTAEQNAAATKLWNQVYSIMQVVPASKVASVLAEIVAEFNEAPLLALDKTKPNHTIIETVVDGDGNEYNYESKNLDYDYTYYAPGNKKFIVDLSTPKSLGLVIITESLTVTEGKMVEEFNNAVRRMWNANLDDLLKGENIEKKEIYNSEIVTEFGKHLYVNLSMSYKDYTTTKDEETVLVTFPSYDHALMYVYEANENAEDDYVSFADLLEELEDAEEDKDDEKIAKAKEEITALFEELGLTYATFDELRAVLEAYAGDDASYTKTQLNTWFASYSASSSSTTFSNVYGDFTGSAYYQLMVLKGILAGKANFTAGDMAALEDYLTHYADTYYDSLQNASAFIEYSIEGKMDVEDLSLILSTIYELTIGTDVTELVKSVSPVYFEKLVAVAKEAASAYKAEDFEGNALKGYELITK